jgi:hypothetical protein
LTTQKEENEEENADHERDRVRGEVEVLTLIAGLILTPLLYLWQQSLAIAQTGLPQWQAYLSSRLGSQYSFDDVMASYFSPFGLSRALPVDIVILAYDCSVILATLSLIIFGTSLVAIEKRDVTRVEKLVQRGQLYLNTVLLLIIFFTVFHLLTTLLFPFRLLLGWADLWTCIGIGVFTAVVLKKGLNNYFNEILNRKN